MNKIKNFLITGAPGTGKTTLVINIADRLGDLNPVGFYTREIRKSGERKGFELVSLDGRKRVLSHTDLDTRFKVSKYRVDIEGFDDFLDTIAFHDSSGKLIIIDEIGKMELFSGKFRNLIRDLLNGDKPVIATIAMRGGGFIAEVKSRKDLRIYTIKSREDQEKILSQILETISDNNS